MTDTLVNVMIREILWISAKPILGMDPALWKSDDFGSWMYKADYGKRDSTFGWEVDHIKAKALGGSDDLSNLRALNWRNNSALGGLVGLALSKPTPRGGLFGLASAWSAK